MMQKRIPDSPKYGNAAMMKNPEGRKPMKEDGKQTRDNRSREKNSDRFQKESERIPAELQKKRKKKNPEIIAAAAQKNLKRIFKNPDGNKGKDNVNEYNKHPKES